MLGRSASCVGKASAAVAPGLAAACEWPSAIMRGGAADGERKPRGGNLRAAQIADVYSFVGD